MLLFIAISIIGYLAFVSQVYFCVTISNVRPFQSLGIGAAIIAYVVIAIVNTIISTLLTIYVPFGLSFDPSLGWHLSNSNMWSSLYSATAYSSNFTMGVASYVFTALYAFVLPIFTIRLIERKVKLR